MTHVSPFVAAETSAKRFQPPSNQPDVSITDLPGNFVRDLQALFTTGVNGTPNVPRGIQVAPKADEAGTISDILLGAEGSTAPITPVIPTELGPLSTTGIPIPPRSPLDASPQVNNTNITSTDSGALTSRQEGGPTNEINDSLLNAIILALGGSPDTFFGGR